MALDLIACPDCGGCGWVPSGIGIENCPACCAQGYVPADTDCEPELTPEEEAELDRWIEEAANQQYAELEAFFRTQGIYEDETPLPDSPSYRMVDEEFWA